MLHSAEGGTAVNTWFKLCSCIGRTSTNCGAKYMLPEKNKDLLSNTIPLRLSTTPNGYDIIRRCREVAEFLATSNSETK